MYYLMFKQGQDMRKGLSEAKKAKMGQHPAGMTAYSQGPDETNEEVMGRMKSVHLGLKYKFIYPGMFIVNKYLKKNYKGVPNAAHNRNLLAFDRAFEKAIEDWNTKSLAHSYNYPITQSSKYWKENTKLGSSNLLRSAKETTLLFALTDTAYRNFLNILMFNITLEMQKEYANTPEGKIGHLIYNSKNITQPEYFYLHQCALTKEMSTYREDDRTCCERQSMKEAAGYLAEGKRREVIQKVEEARAKGIKFTSHDRIVAWFEEMDENPEVAKEMIELAKKYADKK